LADVQVTKTLRVVLSNRETFVAEVKAYSPRWLRGRGSKRPAARAPVLESGKDVAILKIDARNLATSRWGTSDRVVLGQPIHLLGFPGVVAVPRPAGQAERGGGERHVRTRVQLQSKMPAGLR